MRRLVHPLMLVGYLVAVAAGCGDTSGPAQPKVQNPSGTELKPLPPPGGPAPAKKPSGGAN